MNDLFENLKHGWNHLSRREQENIIAAATTTPTTLYTFVKAIKHYRRGDTTKAIFWALLWGGVVANANAAHEARNKRGPRPQRRAAERVSL